MFTVCSALKSVLTSRVSLYDQPRISITLGAWPRNSCLVRLPCPYDGRLFKESFICENVADFAFSWLTGDLCKDAGEALPDSSVSPAPLSTPDPCSETGVQQMLSKS